MTTTNANQHTTLADTISRMAHHAVTGTGHRLTADQVDAARAIIGAALRADRCADRTTIAPRIRRIAEEAIREAIDHLAAARGYAAQPDTIDAQDYAAWGAQDLWPDEAGEMISTLARYAGGDLTRAETRERMDRWATPARGAAECWPILARISGRQIGSPADPAAGYAEAADGVLDRADLGATLAAMIRGRKRTVHRHMMREDDKRWRATHDSVTHDEVDLWLTDAVEGWVDLWRATAALHHGTLAAATAAEAIPPEAID